MRKFIFLLAFACFLQSPAVFAKDEALDLVDQVLALHVKGQHRQAIELLVQQPPFRRNQVDNGSAMLAQNADVAASAGAISRVDILADTTVKGLRRIYVLLPGEIKPVGAMYTFYRAANEWELFSFAYGFELGRAPFSEFSR